MKINEKTTIGRIVMILLTSMILLVLNSGAIGAQESNRKFYNSEKELSTSENECPRTPDASRNATLVWPDFQVNDDQEMCDHFDPAIGVGPNGHRVAAWDDLRDGYHIYYQRYDDTGIPIGGNVALPFYGMDPTVAVDAEGGFIIVYNRGYSIHAAIFESDGTLSGAEIYINYGCGSYIHGIPNISCDSAGNFIVVWPDNINGNWDIYGRLYYATGIATGPKFCINDSGRYDQYFSSVGMNDTGNFVVAWEDERNGNSDIFAQRYDPTGAALGANFRVDDDTGNAGQHKPSICICNSVDFLVSWEDHRNGDYDIFGQRFDASGTPSGSNFIVNDDAGSEDQWTPSAGIDASGIFVIVWEDHRDGNADIYGQKFDDSGTATGPNFIINDDLGSMSQLDPSVAMDSAGNFLAVWEDERIEDYVNIFAQRYDISANPVGTNFCVNSGGGTASQQYPSAGIDDIGNVMIAWMDLRNGDLDIYGQRYDNSGIAMGPNFIINDDTERKDQYLPSVAVNASGYSVVVWWDERNGNNPDIYGQRYAASGMAIGSNFRINDDEWADQTQAYPSMAMNDEGNFVVVWHEWRNGSREIYGQLYDAAGMTIGENFLVNDDADSSKQEYPSVDMDNTGNFVVVWEDDRNGVHSDIYGQRYDFTGTAIGANFIINDNMDGAVVTSPSVGMDGAGKFVVAWEDYRNGSDDKDIYGQWYDATGTAIGVNFRLNDDTEGTDQRRPSVGTDISGRCVVAWEDNRDGSNIYAQRYVNGQTFGTNWPANTDNTGYQSNPSVSCNTERVIFTWEADRTPDQGQDIWASCWEFFNWEINVSIQGTDLVLQWTAVPSADMIHIYREQIPYFEPDIDFNSNLVAMLPGNAVQYSDPFGIGDPNMDAYYRLVARSGSDQEIARSDMIAGECDYHLDIP